MAALTTYQVPVRSCLVFNNWHLVLFLNNQLVSIYYKMFILVASDGVQFKVDKDVLQRSNYLKNMLEGTSTRCCSCEWRDLLGHHIHIFLLLDLGDRDEPIPLYNVSSPVLKKVWVYSHFHQGRCLGVWSISSGSRILQIPSSRAPSFYRGSRRAICADQ